MTHNEWESGKRLSVNNATKDQLKFMVEDRDATIKRLRKELEAKEKDFKALLSSAADFAAEAKKASELLRILADYGQMIKRDNGKYPNVVLDDISKSIEFVLRKWGFKE